MMERSPPPQQFAAMPSLNPASGLTTAFLALAASVVLASAFPTTGPVHAGEIRIIEPGTEPVISGKELDWIYGDTLMRNEKISVIIAAPLRTRDANMTIRGIGGSILDLTLNEPSNDQLSAYIPTAGRYLFQNPNLVTMGREKEAVFWQCRSSRSPGNDGTTATVRYRLRDGAAFVESSILIEGTGAGEASAVDGVRADGWFSFEQSARLAYCSDSFFRQTIGFHVPESSQPPDWKQGRPYQLRYLKTHVDRSNDRLKWSVNIYPSTSLLDLLSASDTSKSEPSMCKFKVTPATPTPPGFQAVNRAEIRLRRSEKPDQDSMSEARSTFTLQTDDGGFAHARLAAGKYIAVASAIGCQETQVEFEWPLDEGVVNLPLGTCSGFRATATDANDNPIPVKATIYATDGEAPDFGPSSTRTFVENCVYSVHGRFQCPLDPGTYEVFFSRGPEYNSVRKLVEVSEGKLSTINVRLDRVVDTTGWVSADFHSHSSPSGDNTSDQYGRVENLLCENIEFAPCTEHNRVSSYTPHLESMQLSHLMATCTGIELTGSPTPINHQNAFPLHRHPHTQNGGGPRAASNPVVQIERLALWDQASTKLVQMNHPDLRRIYGDLDADGVPDKGFRGMLRWTDVVEVHPLETIFQDVANNPPSGRRARIPLFHWMQLLNQGYRIPGVINTDSHYNHHGSGWRRNWLASSTDAPREISTDEMVRQAESGHIVMSTGPFLSVSGSSKTHSQVAIPGDNLSASDGVISLRVTVQCPNWLDVNRVQVFINGRPSEKHHYTRKSHPDLFGTLKDVQKFKSTIILQLDQDAHLIVATIGEGMTMERVMGSRFGRRPPIAVSNPIYVDVDGNGFQPNGDQLGMPLPTTKELQ